MTKIFHNHDLINALQPLPLDEGRKQAIIAVLQEVQDPISPDQINDFITLLDFDGALQKHRISQNEIAQRWRKMKELQREVSQYTTKTKFDLAPYIDKLLDYHSIPRTTTQLSSSRKR